MSFFATIFGYVLKFLYDLVQNYGIAIILFSILVKIVMLPLSIKQQKTLKANAKMQEEMKRIQFMYKNDPEKLNQEVMELYKRTGMSPFSGCLSSIIQLILLLSVFFMVSSPLTYMVGMDKDVIANMKEIVNEANGTQNTRYSEIAIIQYVRKLDNNSNINNDETVIEEENKQNVNTINDEKTTETLEENKDVESNKFDIKQYADQAKLNMDFFGIDLSNVPTQNDGNWTKWIIPVLYVLSSFISIRLTSMNGVKTKSDKKLITDGNESNDTNVNPMGDTSKAMMWMMPIMSVSIAIIAPLGLALYWLMNNSLMIVERLVLNKVLNKEEEAEKNA